MDGSDKSRSGGLTQAYRIESPEEARPFYDGWAQGYEAEVAEHGYITPERCAEALARFAADLSRPIMDLGCGTGLSGLALRAAGFALIDGFDLSEGMLDQARAKGLYRDLAVTDLSQPLELPDDVYANAAAVGCVSPEYMPPTVIDAIMGKLPAGGCLVFSVNDHAAADGSIKGRVCELIDCGWAELLFCEYGDHIPKIGLKATVYVMRRR